MALTNANTVGQWFTDYLRSGYVTNLQANTTYLKKTEANTTYLKKTEASSTYLPSTTAASTYFPISSYAKSSTAEFFAGTTTVKYIDPGLIKSASAFVTLTDAASIAWNMSTGINFWVTLGGNRTLANPTNLIPGRSGILRVSQPSGGGRTLSFGSNYVFDSASVVSIATTSLQQSFIGYLVLDPTYVLLTLVAKGI